jgi:hypothetical protein
VIVIDVRRNEVAAAEAERAEWFRDPLFLSLAALTIVLPFLVWIGSLSFSLVSEDLADLVQDANLPFWKAFDALFRPLRNILLRNVMAPVFGTTPQPYHILLFVLYSATVLSVWWMARQFSGNSRALIVTAVFALFPRNYTLMFWVASVQDLLAIPLIVMAVVFWLRRRDFIALACYAVALGFKETAITCPALLLLADVVLKKDLRIRRYLPIAVLTVCYAGFVTLTKSRSVAHSDGIYGLTPFGAPLAEIRELANLALPFHSAFGLRDLGLADWLIVAAVIGVLAILAIRSRQRRLALFGVGWALIALAPTSLFARSVNSDHYLMFPLVGVVMLLSAVIEGHETVATLAALIFCMAGYSQLLGYRQTWQADAERFVAFQREIRNKVHAPVQRITLVNLTHAGISNAVRAVTMQAGIPESVPVRHNFSHPGDDRQESLMKRLSVCRAADSADKTFIYDRGVLVDISGPCATEVIDGDVSTRAYAWF